MLNRVRKDFINLLGWKTDKKIVVIESDDWGTISIPTKKVRESLIKKGLNLSDSSFSQYDTLESENDFTALYEILSLHKDKYGNPPCITFCTIVGNPDFERIREDKFEKYHFKSFTETYREYPGSNECLSLFKEGIEKGYIYPQLHGREHLNPFEWLRLLKIGVKDELEIFNTHSITGLKAHESNRFKAYHAAFDYESQKELEGFEKVLNEAQDLFERVFGFRSKSFVAPTGIRSDKMDLYLKGCGIDYHQLGQQFLPLAESRNTIRHRFFGSKNEYGQTYWRRNGFFEPSRDSNKNWVPNVLAEMKSAFKMSKPFIISSHRVNFIGGHDEKNRKFGLLQLNDLISAMLKTEPDIEFFNSAQLGDEMVKNPNYTLGLDIGKFKYDQTFKG